MQRLFLLTCCSLVLAFCIFRFKKNEPSTIAAGEGLVIPKAWLQTMPNPKTPKADVRPADQTFLTFPEWFLVFSPEEQAHYFKHHTATSFPFVSHIAQIWQSYNIVNNQIKDNFPVNTGYHFMIWVIGVSATVEYAIKAGYETVIGRITDTEEPLTEEDQFNASFTQSYVDFIKDRPWYEYNFTEQFNDLWMNTSLLGEHWFRKLERRYILTSELLVKIGYGKLIGLGTQQMYEVALPTTAVVLDNDSIQALPRYDRFAAAALGVAQRGHTFKEIAGNNSAVLFTVLVPANHVGSYPQAQTVFTQPITSNPSMKRLALATPVPQLCALLKQLNDEHVFVEHVFDF